MVEEDFDEVEENIRILMTEELQIHHRLEGHGEVIAACPVCHAHTPRVA
jgi:hypothetical protein